MSFGVGFQTMRKSPDIQARHNGIMPIIPDLKRMKNNENSKASLDYTTEALLFAFCFLKTLKITKFDHSLRQKTLLYMQSQKSNG